jgi:hypothetical protein
MYHVVKAIRSPFTTIESSKRLTFPSEYVSGRDAYGTQAAHSSLYVLALVTSLVFFELKIQNKVRILMAQLCQHKRQPHSSLYHTSYGITCSPPLRICNPTVLT